MICCEQAVYDNVCDGPCPLGPASRRADVNPIHYVTFLVTVRVICQSLQHSSLGGILYLGQGLENECPI